MDEKPKKTLTDFIDENRNLLSTIGILTALSVFINQLPGDLAKSLLGLHDILRTVSGLLCFLAILAFFEVMKNSLAYPDKGLVKLFSTVLGLVFFIFVLVYILTFSVGIRAFISMTVFVVLSLIVFALVALPFRKIMQKTSFLRFQSRQIREQLIPSLISLGLIVVAIYLSQHFYMYYAIKNALVHFLERAVSIF